MTVEDLIEELKRMPPTAVVFALAPIAIDGRPVFEILIEDLEYEYGRVVVRLNRE